jgi:hypothetical protein
MLRIWTVLAAAACTAITTTTTAQTTRPVEAGTTTTTTVVDGSAAIPAAPEPTQRQPWPRRVEGFAKALAAGNAQAIDAALSARATVRRFDVGASADPTRLAERLARSTVIGQHAYLHPPLVMAADIAADFKNAVGIPDKAKLRFLVDDEQEIKRANATAVQWVVEQLDVRAGTPVAVIVLWTPRPGAPGAKPDDAATSYDVTFVLCRGEEADDHEFKINAVVYGIPVPENP